MDQIFLKELTLYCIEPDIEIPISISDTQYIHGDIGSGKSSFVRLLLFALGGDYEDTPALQKRLHRVKLELKLGDICYYLSRAVKSETITISREDKSNDPDTIFHIKSRLKTPEEQTQAYTFSEYLLKNLKTEANANISFSQLLPFVFLQQENLDSSFFDLIKEKNARKSIQYILNYDYSYEIGLQKEIRRTINDIKKINGKLESRDELFQELGFPTSNISYEKAKDSLEEEYKSYMSKLDLIERSNLTNQKHPLDLQIQKSVELSKEIYKIRVQINEMEISTLKSSNQKKSRQTCPCCSKYLPKRAENECTLCGQENIVNDKDTKIISKEYKNIHIELDNQIKRKEREKENLDRIIEQQWKYPTPKKMAERDVLVGQIEKTRHRLEKISSYKEKLDFSVEKENNALSKLEPYLDQQKESLRTFQKDTGKIDPSLRTDLFELFVDCLKRCKLLSQDITIEGYIDENTYVPYFRINNATEKTSFYNIGSGGQKVLFKSCFAIALQRLSFKKSLRLPSILIIDTPTKNIGEIVNRENCVSFYQMIADLKKDELKRTQIILVDKEYPQEVPPPENSTLRRMSRSLIGTKEGPLIPDAIH